MRRAAFDQNHESFRALNQQMWQIPLISMTLTGGLWFGVSTVEDFPVFQLSLLLLAAAGNGALFFIILRLRFVMERHLTWLKNSYPAGFVDASDGKKCYQRPFVVRFLFQFMLFLAAALSVVLLLVTAWANREGLFGMTKDDPALSYYEAHAENLADGYETLSFETAHPALVSLIQSRFLNRKISALDVGAGTGRDASWFAERGDRIVAVEPSPAMQRIGKQLHPAPQIEWRTDSLPDLGQTVVSGEKFDLILLSAVWMHVEPTKRQQSIKTLISLLKPGGTIYLTLRLGPSESKRGIYRVSEDELAKLLKPLGLQPTILGEQPDLLGRDSISWVSLSINMP